MLTKIEEFMFQGRNFTHAVVEFALTQDKLLLTIAPWCDLNSTFSAEFYDYKITSLSVDPNPDEHTDLNLPWDIIGFDSYELESNRWEFVLHCDDIEYVFESSFPTLAVK
ncbi:hypothetical protein [Tolypothrix sp. VBCCA 56010]|uniref:hypothetical protein n=1 Tax=Tolypothrix sp. VBCCA 56010 TaxID=3137731 RepID=UPI003D7E01F2